MAAPRRLETPEELKQLVDKYRGFVFDLDGTLWRGHKVIDGVHGALDWLRALGKDVIFVTNNSMKSRATYADKFKALGIQARKEEIYSSAYSAASYLKSIGFNKKVYVVGEQGILDELRDVGIAAFGGPQDNDKRISFADGAIQQDPEVGAVVCGVDPGLSYWKINYAAQCLLENPGCLFVATNADSRGHFIPNQEWPGAGATVGAIKAVVEREPILTGKPSTFLLAEIQEEHGVQPGELLMVGDRLDTDILWGHSSGMDTCLVLTGVTDEALLNHPATQVQPTYVLASWGNILAAKAAAAADQGDSKQQLLEPQQQQQQQEMVAAPAAS